MAFVEKQIRAQPQLRVAGRHIKRYHVTGDGRAIDDIQQDAAYAFLPGLLPEPDDTPPATFVVLHQGGAGIYLNAYSWFYGNVLYARFAVAGDPFLGGTKGDLTSFSEVAMPVIGCVWELPPLAHERSAWVRHLLQPEQPDLTGYLADLLPDGPIGAP